MDLEQIVIGNLVHYGRLAMHIARDILTEKDFHLDTYKNAFSFMSGLYKEGQDWDLPLVAINLKGEGDSSIIAGSTMDGISSIALFPHFVVDLRRRTLDLELKTAMNEGADYTEIKNKIIELEGVKVQTELATSAKSAVNTALAEFEKSCHEPNEMKTGFSKIDEDIGGLYRSDLVIVGGRTSMGKTTFALNMALNVIKQNKKVVILNGEMSTSQLVYRLLCMEGDYDSSKIRNKQMTDSDWQGLAKIGARFSQYFFQFYCKGSITVALTANLIKKYSPDLVIVDYLQLMMDSQGKESRAQHLSNLARGLKNLAIEYNTCIVALSQLNREVEHRDKGIPRLADLRESGGIEEAADIVFLIYVTKPEDTEAPQTHVYIAKNRHGQANMDYLIDFNMRSLKMEGI